MYPLAIAVIRLLGQCLFLITICGTILTTSSATAPSTEPHTERGTYIVDLDPERRDLLEDLAVPLSCPDEPDAGRRRGITISKRKLQIIYIFYYNVRDFRIVADNHFI